MTPTKLTLLSWPPDSDCSSIDVEPFSCPNYCTIHIGDLWFGSRDSLYSPQIQIGFFLYTSTSLMHYTISHIFRNWLSRLDANVRLLASSLMGFNLYHYYAGSKARKSTSDSFSSTTCDGCLVSQLSCLYSYECDMISLLVYVWRSIKMIVIRPITSQKARRSILAHHHFADRILLHSFFPFLLRRSTIAVTWTGFLYNAMSTGPFKRKPKRSKSSANEWLAMGRTLC